MHSLYHIIPCVCPALRIKVPYSPYSFNKHKNEKYEHRNIKSNFVNNKTCLYATYIAYAKENAQSSWKKKQFK